MRNRKGFTIMELLVVVAVIFILVAVSQAFISGLIERSKEAKDLADLRSAYAKVAATSLSNIDSKEEAVSDSTVFEENGNYYAFVDAIQTLPGWSDEKTHEIGGCYIPGDSDGAVVKRWKVELITEENEFVITAVG